MTTGPIPVYATDGTRVALMRFPTRLPLTFYMPVPNGHIYFTERALIKNSRKFERVSTDTGFEYREVPPERRRWWQENPDRDEGCYMAPE